MKDPWTVIRKPIVTEKSYASVQKNVYTFIVDKSSGKHDIKYAVEKAFSVKVKEVRTSTHKGKVKKMKNMVMLGKRSDSKKAFVTLMPGYRLDII